jgi:aspartyl-tRNA(Asn)/glutamyl-tRNA(Gln) amidotransferase subunit C
MKIDLDTVDRIAELARLEFNAEEKEAILNDMSRMLDFVDKLKELNTEGVEPLVFITESENIFRDDEERLDITQADALRNAPKKDLYYFRVPKVIRQ